jgi:tripartite-type tricarboxylate transporter receptor subunit TctC
LAHGVAPAGTSKEVVEKLNAELKSVVMEPETQHELSTRGFIPLETPSPVELAAFVKSEIVRWDDVIKQAGAAGIE